MLVSATKATAMISTMGLALGKAQKKKKKKSLPKGSIWHTEKHQVIVSLGNASLILALALAHQPGAAVFSE